MNAHAHRLTGFTLVEMVATILLLGILSAAVGAFITRPVEGYRDLVRRAALVDAAESALRRMERDVRTALPNSVRVTDLGGGGFALEMLPILDGAMYRREPGGGVSPGAPGRPYRLDVGSADDQWDIHKYFRRISVPFTSSTHRIVINNLGVAATTSTCDAYRATDSPAVITPLGTTISITATGNPEGGSNAHNILLSTAHTFPTVATCAIGTDRFRLYIIETPVTYLCTPDTANPANGKLVRYAGYAITATQPNDATAAPLATATSALIADGVRDCSFNSNTDEIRNRMLATFVMTVEDEGETVRLIHQVQMDNSP